MKRRNWLIAALLLICVMVMSTVLVACKPDEPDPKPDPKPSELTKSDFINQMMETASTLYSVDNAKYMSLDFKVGTSLKDNRGTTDKNEFNYELVVKANINLNEDIYNDENAVEKIDKKSNFLIQINEKEGTTVNELFSLLYASEFGEDGAFVGNYFYLAFANAEKPFKIDAFSFSKILYAIAPAPAAAAEGGFDIASLIPTVLTLIVSDEGFAIENDTYSFKIDLNQVWAMVGPMLSGLLENPEDLQIEGIDLPAILDQVGGAIQEIWPGLSIEVDGEENLVDTVAELIKYIDTVFPKIVINASFTFGKNDFKANFAVDYAADKDATKSDYVFTLDIAKASISSYNSQLDVFADYKWEKAELAEIDSFGLLNFAVDGTIEFSDIPGEVDGKNNPLNMLNPDNAKLNYSLDMDINPFVLFDGLTLDNIKRLGYFNLTVNGAGADTSNIVTIHCNFADGAAYLNIDTVNKAHAGTINRLPIGGKIEFNALMDAITIMGGGSVDVKAPSAEDAENTTVKTILNALKAAINVFNLDDITNKGVVMDTTYDALYAIFKDIPAIDTGMGIIIGSDMITTVLRQLLFNEADSMAVKVNENGVVYQGCEKIGVEDIDFSAFEEDDVVGLDNASISKNAYEQYVDFSDKNEPYFEYGQSFENGLAFCPGENDFDYTIAMNGTNAITGEKVTDAKMVYLGNQGYDPYKAGWQYIRVYYGANNNWNNTVALMVDLAKILYGIMPILPINGIQYVDTWVCVYDPVPTEAAFLQVNGTNKFLASENVADKLDATMYYANGRSVKVTSDMISSAAPIFDATGKTITMAGNFTLNVDYYNVHAEIQVNVGALTMNEITSIPLDGKTELFDLLAPKYTYVDNYGVWHHDILDVTIDEIKVGPKTYTADEAFIEGTTAFIKDHSKFNANFKLKVTFSYEVDGVKATKTIEKIPFTVQDNIMIMPGTTTINYYAPVATHTFFKIRTGVSPSLIFYDVKYDADLGEYVAKDSKTGNVYDGEFTIEVADGTLTNGRFATAGKHIIKATLSNGSYNMIEVTVKEPFASRAKTITDKAPTFKLSDLTTFGFDASYLDETLAPAMSQAPFFMWNATDKVWYLASRATGSVAPIDSTKYTWSISFTRSGAAVNYTCAETTGVITLEGYGDCNFTITITPADSSKAALTATGTIKDSRTVPQA